MTAPLLLTMSQAASRFLRPTRGPKDDVESLRSKLAELITLPQTIRNAGIPGHEFRFSRVRAVHRQPFGPGSGIPKCVVYAGGRCVTLVDKTLPLAREGGGTDGIGLFSHAKLRG